MISAGNQEHDALSQLLATLSPGQLVQPGIVGEWSIKDVLAHLTAWEQMAIGWYTAGARGERPGLPAPGYKWNETPALNRHIYEQHCDQALDDVMAAYASSFDEIMAVIESEPEDGLFTPGVHGWTGKNNMATYFISATSSHYRWARTEIRKGLRSQSQ